MKAPWGLALSITPNRAIWISRVWLAAALITLFSPAITVADEVIMQVYLQSVDYGERIFLLENQNDVYLSLKDFRELGFSPPPANALAKKKGYVSLPEMAPSVKYEIDINTATLTITPDPEILEGSTVSFGNKGKTPPPAKRIPAAYLNWYLNYERSEKTYKDTLSVPLEFAYSAGEYAFYTGFIYTKDGDEDKSDLYMRRQTRLTRDEPGKMVRWQAGDTAISSGRLGGAAILGGMSVARSFFMQPDFTPYPGNDISWIATQSSKADIYVNDVLVGQREIMPGEFSAKDLPLITGSGEVRVELTDAAGNIDIIEGTLYASSRLLEPGLHDYGYGLGWIRENLANESFDYGRPAFIGHHRYGITDWFTLGTGLELMKGLYNASPQATLLLGGLGQIELNGAASFIEEKDSTAGNYKGVAGLAQYSYVNKGFSAYLTSSYQSRRYATISLDAVDDEKEKRELSAGLNYNFGLIGTLGASGSRSTDWNDLDTDNIIASWSTQLFDGISLNIRGQRTQTEDDEPQYTAWAGLTGFFGSGHSLSFEHTKTDNIRRQKLQLKKNAPISKGFGYDVDISRADGGTRDNDYGSTGTLRYNGDHTKTAVNYRYGTDTLSFGTTVSGAISFVDGEINYSRPINDSFALVRVGAPEAVRIYNNNSYNGSTGKYWNMVVPELPSYSKANINFKPLELPIIYKAGPSSYAYTPAFRSGHVVTLDIEAIHAIYGYLNVEGKPIEFAPVCIEAGWEEDIDCSMLGNGGEFYFENLPPGSVVLRADTKKGSCYADIPVPSSDDIIVEIGEVSCEIR